MFAAHAVHAVDPSMSAYVDNGHCVHAVRTATAADAFDEDAFDASLPS
jgi:hypothetical protein